MQTSVSKLFEYHGGFIGSPNLGPEGFGNFQRRFADAARRDRRGDKLA
jgi:hypothetical protein